jgi:N-acetylmuramoyl-L-alanine amidase
VRQIFGLILLGSVFTPSLALANEQSLLVVYPRTNHKTTADKIFFIGTAPSAGQVSINGKVINRSKAGHFAPSFPLQLGDNIFDVRYQNQNLQIKVTRLTNQPEIPKGLAFAKDSLTPAVNIARLPGELICFSAIAPPNATVSVKLASQTIPLTPQRSQVQLPSNLSALTGLNQPTVNNSASKFEGCTTLSPFGSLIYGNNITDGPTTIIHGNNIISSEILEISYRDTTNLDLGKSVFQATLNGKTITQEGGAIQILSPTALEVAEVTVDSGVARTGPSSDFSRLTPLPKGTRASVTGKEGDWLRLDYGGWINSKETTILPKGTTPPRTIIRSVTSRKFSDRTEIIFPLSVPVPVSVQQGDDTFTLNLYNTTAQTDTIRLDDNPHISRLDWQQITPGHAQYIFNFKKSQQWGYKLRYDGTSLILSLRNPPLVERSRKPLSGMKILLDPGHGGKESGATGPNGYLEKDLNLVVSKMLQDELIKRGAKVVMTRTDDRDVSLVERQVIIDKEEPHIALSIHYNSLPDNGDAENTKGFGSFWYNTQAHSLAVFLHNYIVKELKRPSYGVFWNNLALTRPTSSPSVLLEIGFMSNPEEFELMTQEKEQKRTAKAIAEGVVEWFKSVR